MHHFIGTWPYGLRSRNLLHLVNDRKNIFVEMRLSAEGRDSIEKVPTPRGFAYRLQVLSLEEPEIIRRLATICLSDPADITVRIKGQRM